MSHTPESQLTERLHTEAKVRQGAFLQALAALDAPLALTFEQIGADEWADHPALLAWPQLQSYIIKLKQVDAALCQQQLGLYGLCSDCEADISREQLYQDPCRQRCSHCHAKHLNSQQASWAL
ncbi:transcriptional regulator, TraR/DksA family protein [Oceanisphaera pacifica]|uniref:Transcriptional regulator, TraR/DksA family protein n=1 Tax=Oceanisphaera pacifica TaxID=2818389 RepID=A0ABS3NDM6_9GAMM|nr:transcriptional regulator, TraR/DksA family protein [Oceanisphaera pacifica]MBO1518699.1 transcriptional regulator, TraR/DksA family protein [Oceanisphaera pacifica]